ncbi:MAG: hypothetical protein HC831_01935, partial [Chloroflexia bacterium]|nr:hypothetical protein [Chloroflexia bacterium]
MNNFDLTLRGTPFANPGAYLDPGTGILITNGTFTIPAELVPLNMNLTVAAGTLTYNGALLNNVVKTGNLTLGTNDVVTTGNWSGNGTLNATTNSRRVTFQVGAAQTLSNGTYNFYDLEINKSANGLTLNRDINVAHNWVLNQGAFTPGIRRVTLNGTTVSDIGGLLPTTFYNLRLNKTAGATLSNNVTVTNNMDFNANGRVTLGNWDFTAANPATISNANTNRCFITNGTGRLVRTGAAGGFTFPVAAYDGATYFYAPAVFPAGASSNVGVRAVYGQHPDNTCGSEYLEQYWNISTDIGGSLVGGNYTFTPTPTLIHGAPQGAYYYGGTWTDGGNPVATPNFNVTLPALGASDELDVSGIDMSPPTVLPPIVISHPVITSADVGGTFSVTVQFSESMDIGSTPTISLIPPQVATLTQQPGAWSTTNLLNPNDTYTFNFLINNSSAYVDDIDIQVTNGSDACGNLQTVVGDLPDAFDIHMSCAVAISAGLPQRLCEAVPGGLLANTTMAATDPSPATGTWSRVSGPGVFPVGNFGNINSPTTTLTGLAQGMHIFRWTISGGGACDDDYDVTIYNDQPTAASAGLDDESCDGTYNLLANNPVYGTGSWTVVLPAPPTVIFANNTLATTTVSNLGAGDNTLTWTITNAACSSSDAVVIVNNAVEPPIVTAGNNQTLCKNNTTMGGATVPGVSQTGQWSIVQGGGTFTNPTYYGTTVTSIPRRDNIYRWTITEGTCSASADVTISNYSVAADAGLDDYTCDGGYVLQGNNPATQNITIPAIAATGTWTTPGPGNITNINLYNSYVDNLDLDANTFYWTMDNGACTDQDTVIISNDMPTIPWAGDDDTFCGINFTPSGYSSIYNALSATPADIARGEVGYWTQTAGSGTFLDPSTSPTMRVDDLAQYAQLTGPDFWSLSPTVNTFRWTITYNNCELYDEVTITNAAPDSAWAGPDQTVCFDEVLLNAEDHGSRAQTHQWTIQSPGQTVETFEDINKWNSYVQFLQSANTTFRWTKTNVINGVTCTVWDETVVTKTNNTGRPNAGPNQIICSDSTTLTATDPEIGFPATDVVTGEWSVLQGPTAAPFNFADATSPTTAVTGLSRQTYVFRWTVTNATQGCIATADVDITNALPSDAVAAPASLTVCSDTAWLSATRPMPGSTGYWTVEAGSGTLSNNTCQDFLCDVLVTNLSPGLNTIRWTTERTYSEAGPPAQSRTCYLSQDVEVTNNTIFMSGLVDLTTCNDTAVLSAPSPGIGETGVWILSAGSGTIINANSNSTMVVGLNPDANQFIWRLTNATCSNQRSLVVTNNNPSDPTASAPFNFTCDSTTLISGNAPAHGIGQWIVNQGGGIISDVNDPNTNVTGMPGGLNIYEWRITKNGCAESDTVHVYNRAVLADAGTAGPVCGEAPNTSTVQLNGSIPDYSDGETGMWTIVTSPTGNILTPTLYNTFVEDMSNGPNTFRWRITNGYCSDDSVVVVNVNIPTTAIAEADKEVCASLTDVVTLSANPVDVGKGETGLWSMKPGFGSGTFSNATSHNATIINLGYNLNIIYWTISYNGCTSRDSLYITNNYIYADAGLDTAICSDTYTLAANDPTVNDLVGFDQASGIWSVSLGSGTFAAPTFYNTSVSGLSTALTNNLRWTVTKGGCSDWDEVSIINNEFTITANVDQTVCNNFATLNGQQPGVGESGVWTLVSGSGGFTNASLYNTQVTGLSSGSTNTFRWTVSNATCSASDEMNVYYNYVTADAGAEQRVCTTSATLGGNQPPAGASGNWTITTGGPTTTVVSPSSYNSMVTGLDNGQNTFLWTVSRTLNSVTCSASSSVNVFNDTPTTANVEADNEVCNNSTQLTVITIPTIGTGVWSAVDNLAIFDNSLGFNPTVTGLNLDTNTFRWTVTNQACTSTDDVIITNHMVVADAGLNGTTACADTYNLQGNAPTQGAGVWTQISGLPAVIDNSLDNLSEVSSLSQGATSFRWTVTLGGCSDFDDVEIVNNSITATAGANVVTCNDFYPNLSGNDVSGVGGTGLWTVDGFTADITTPTLYNTGVTNLNPGGNTFRWTVTSGAEGCTDQAVLTVTNSSVTSNAGVDFETCDANITLGAQDPVPATGYWTQSSGNPVVIVTSANYDSQVTGLTGGVYAFTWNVTNGSCSDAATVVVTNSSPQAAIAGTGAPEVCTGNGTLVGNILLVGESGIWTIPSGSGSIANVSQNNTTVSNLGLGANTFRWTITKGTNVTCTSSATVTITNNQVAANAGNDRNVCTSTVNLQATQPSQGTGVWTKFGVNPSTITDPTLRTTSVTGLADNTSHGFTWTVTQGSCTASDDVYINNNRVLADAGADQSTCNNSINLDGNDVSGVGATGLWTKQVGNGSIITTPTLYNTGVTNLDPGINQFTWTVTSAGSCVSSDMIEITYNYITANAGLDLETCSSSEALSAGSPAPGSGTWTQIGGNPAIITGSNSQNATVSGLTSGNYVFQWTVLYNGCTATDDVAITNSSPQTAMANTPSPESCTGNGTLVGTALQPGESGVWTIPSGSGSIANVSQNNTTVSNLGLGANTFRWTITKGTNVTCTSSAT